MRSTSYLSLILLLGLVFTLSLSGRADQKGTTAPSPAKGLSVPDAEKQPPVALPAKKQAVVKPGRAAPPTAAKQQTRAAVEAMVRAQKAAGGSVLAGTLLEQDDDTDVFQKHLAELAKKYAVLTHSSSWLPKRRSATLDTQLIDSLRDSARLLDDKANQVEKQRQYSDADRLRRHADQLRLIARAVEQGSTITAPTYPYAAPPSYAPMAAVPSPPIMTPSYGTHNYGTPPPITYPTPYAAPPSNSPPVLTPPRYPNGTTPSPYRSKTTPKLEAKPYTPPSKTPFQLAPTYAPG